jgi:hypothetical protein
MVDGVGDSDGKWSWGDNGDHDLEGDVVIEYRVVAVDLRERSKEHGTMGES